MTFIEKAYLNGILIAKKWLDAAIASQQSSETIQSFERIYLQAIDKYNHLKKN